MQMEVVEDKGSFRYAQKTNGIQVKHWCGTPDGPTAFYWECI